MSEVICMGEDDERTRVVAACLQRLRGPATDRPAPPEEETRPHLQALRASGRIAAEAVDGGDRQRIAYVPSLAAKRAMFEGDGQGGWPRRVERYMEKDAQRVAGAVFRLPVHGGDEVIEAFITDWSPFPAACAIAVHPGHPLADGCDNQPNRWTGRYARHVLTGDLLAIWTADWVRPEFGTGSVIVNPAHSEVDLAFARLVGLPIRFGLAPEPPTTDPATWLEPPVLNTGYAVRTGVADGETAESARRTYLTRLEEAGHAAPFVDRVLPPLALGTAADPRALAGLELRSAVASIIARPLGGGDVVVTSVAAIPELVTLRALHIDVHGADMDGSAIVLIQPAADGAAGEEGSRERALALVGSGRLDEVLALKAQQVEQAARFYENHERLGAPEPVDLAQKPPKRVARVLADARSGQTALAFGELYKLQRDLRQKPDAVGAGDRYAYFAAAYALAGVDTPDGYRLADVLGDEI